MREENENGEGGEMKRRRRKEEGGGGGGEEEKRCPSHLRYPGEMEKEKKRVGLSGQTFTECTFLFGRLARRGGCRSDRLIFLLPTPPHIRGGMMKGCISGICDREKNDFIPRGGGGG